MLLYLKKNLKKNLLNIILLFLIIIYTNFFLNIYLLFNQSKDTRLTNNYGYCEKQGYGFIKKYSKKYKLENNTKILNFKKNLYPNSGLFINQFYNPSKYKYIILLNSNEVPKSKKILEQEYNCYILKND